MYREHIRFIASLVIGFAFIAYVVFQARFFLIGPSLDILEPSAGCCATTTIHVRGTVTHATRITVNGYPIDTDRSGRFSYPLVIPDGYSILTVTAQDRYGRTRTFTRELFLATP